MRNIVHIVLIFNVIIMLYIEQYLVSILFTLIILVYRKREKTSRKKIKKSASISEDVAEAMASKIIFEAQQHRKVRDDVNHLNIGSSEEE
jgi:predicted amino acid-binding ACT domain protein|tara:strand:+ start:451 stop:720 length:270 start_codon:yes stop_codon:yes gene_type:complete